MNCYDLLDDVSTYPNLYSYHAMVKGRQVGPNQRQVGPNQRLVAQPEGFIDCKSYHFVVYGIIEPSASC